MMVEISVIIPVYGVERYISRCCKSLFEQSFKNDIEFIFIDDCTIDNSIAIIQDILKEYPGRTSQVKIIHHDKNKGLPAARNTGLAIAQGKYIVHVDADDFLEADMIESLHDCAEKNEADFVWSDYFLSFETKEKIIKQPCTEIPNEAVRHMLRGSMKYNVWNKICRKSLYDISSISFPDGNAMGEDLTMIMVCLNATKCAHINRPLYHYVQNPNQMTADLSESKQKALLFNCDRVSDYINDNFSHLEFDTELAALKQLMKWPFLLDGKLSSYRRWLSWFPESNRHIMHTQGVNLRIRLIEWCAAKKLFPIVWLHYWLVCKFYYGIVYH